MNTLTKIFLAASFIFLHLSTVVGQGLHTRQAPLPCLNKTFSIVAHIVRDTFGEPNITEAAIEDALLTANEAFEPICVAFDICEFRYIDNFQYDMVEVGGPKWNELQIKHHVQRRINMFFVADIGDDNSYVCGFAGLGQITNMDAGGIVIKKGECIAPGSGTVVHELGHYFSLLHTFEGEGAELVNGDNCETEGDLICDTPADPFRVGDDPLDYVDVDNGCRFINSRMDANGELYRPDVGNYMSYYPSACSCGFTYEQYVKMANTYLSSSPRMW